MNKKNVASSILVLYLAVLFSVIGMSFSAFVFKDTKIIVQSIKVQAAQGVSVYDDEKCTQTTNTLKLSNMDLGLKPATGEINAETLVPSTINNEGTSEGYYADVYVKSSGGFKVLISDISIESDHEKNKVNEEKKNIFISIMDVKDSTCTLEKNGEILASFNNIESVKKLTFLIWLGGLAGEELEGAKISFSLKFEML